MYRVFEGIGVLVLLGFVRAAFGYSNKDEFRIRGKDLAVLVGVYGCFLIGVAYHVLVNFINSNLSVSTGWYVYVVIVPEALLTMTGLFFLFSTRWRRGCIPCVIGCFTALELYTVHFLLIPYYTGFIDHSPTGGLRAFHVSQLNNGGFATMLERLVANKPDYVNVPVFLFLWTLFLISVAALLVTSTRVGFRSDL